MPKDERLTALLYILMRDHVTPGLMIKLIHDIPPGPFIYSNKHLEAMAREYLERLNA